VRLRLTLLYGASSSRALALLAVTYLLVACQYMGNEKIFGVGIPAGAGDLSPSIPVKPGTLAPLPRDFAGGEAVVVDRNSEAALRELALALAIMAILSIWIGWLVAERVLRPLRTITDAARDIPASSPKRTAIC
jgi:hypothetical protein